MRIAAAEAQISFFSRFDDSGIYVDCGGTTPLWLRASHIQARALFPTVKEKRRHAAAVHSLRWNQPLCTRNREDPWPLPGHKSRLTRHAKPLLSALTSQCN